MCWPSSGAVAGATAGVSLKLTGRGDHVDLALRPRHSGQVAVVPDGPIGDDLGVVAHRSEAQVGSGEEVAPLGRRAGAEGLVEQREQCRLLLAEVERLGKLLGELGPPEDLEEAGARLADDTDDRQPPVRRREDGVQAGDVGVAAVRRPTGGTGQEAPGDLARLGPDLPTQQRRVDALPAPRAGAGDECSEDAADEVLGGDVVGDGDPDGRRLAAGAPGRADQPTDGLGAEVGTLAAGIRPDQPERRAGGVDHLVVAGRDVVVPEAPGVHRSGLEVGDHHVRPRGQPQEDLAAFGAAEIRRDAALAAVARREVGATDVTSLHWQPPGLVAEPGQLDLDDIGAPLTERRRGLWALHQQPGLDDLDSVQRSCHGTDRTCVGDHYGHRHGDR